MPQSVPGLGVITTVAGKGPCSGGGDNVPATSACLAHPDGVAVAPDGSLYIADDSAACVRRVTGDGIIRTVAGQCGTAGASGDGGPATSALLSTPVDIAFGPDGSLYVADSSPNSNRIRKIDPTGIITTIVGSGAVGFSGDGGPATQAALNFPMGVDVTSDGTIFVSELLNARIRRVGPDGIIRTVAGVGTTSCFSQNTKGYGGPATAAHLCQVDKVRAAADGSFYILEGGAGIVDRVGTDGIIRLFAGTGGSAYSGDGGPATQATLGVGNVTDIALGPEGSVYISDGFATVRRVDPSGIISRVAGIPNASVTFSGDNVPATAAAMGPAGLSMAPDGTLYIAEPLNQRVRRVQPGLPNFSFNGTSLEIASEDGTQLYVFDANGRHLETLDAVTGTTRYQFNYDADGHLSAVADVAGNTTTINRDANGNPTALVSPYGQSTTLSVDVNGYLSAVQDPSGAPDAVCVRTAGPHGDDDRPARRSASVQLRPQWQADRGPGSLRWLESPRAHRNRFGWIRRLDHVRARRAIDVSDDDVRDWHICPTQHAAERPADPRLRSQAPG